MKQRVHVFRGVIALLLVVGLAFSACRAGTTRGSLEVKAGDTIEEKLRIAQSVVTAERLVRLKAQLKDRVPAVTDEQLAGLGLSWSLIQSGGAVTVNESSVGNNEAANGAGEFIGLNRKPGNYVIVTVGVQHNSSFDPEPILDAAFLILEPEVNPPVLLEACQGQAGLTICAGSAVPVQGWHRMEMPDENRVVWVTPTSSLTSGDIQSAQLGTDERDQRTVTIQFTDAGAEKMRKLSTTQIGKPVAMLLEGNVIWAPKVNGEISKDAVITGGPKGVPSEVAGRILASVNQK